MIDKYFTTIKQDLNTIKAHFSSDDADKSLKPTDVKVHHATIRLLSASVMALGIGIVFFALPIVSSGVSILGLAIGIAAFVFAHDMFKLSQNFETIYFENGLPKYFSLNFSAAQEEKMADDLEEGTILRPLLKKYRENWKPGLLVEFLPQPKTN